MTIRMFCKIEDVLGLQRNAIKIGIMDEEKRTTVNLKNIQSTHSKLVTSRYRYKRTSQRDVHTSIIVSKSVEMVDLTIALFAKFRVNGNIFDILNIGKMQQSIII